MIAYRIWQVAGWTMLHYLWVGGGLGTAMLALRWGLRSASANVRYLAALGGLALMTVAPPLIAVYVMHDLGPLPSSPLPAAALEQSAAEPPAAPLEKLPPQIEPAVPAPPLPAAAPAPRGTSGFTVALEPLLEAAVLYLPWLWIVGAPLVLLLTTAGMVGAERLRRQSRPAEDATIAALCRRLAASLKLSRRVGVAVCDRIAAPILVGIVRPMILLPAVALTGWDPQQLEMVLLHELLHVRRWDNLVNLVQRIVESVLFFHPMIWVVSAWVRREREHCCDAAVVAHTRQPQAYAQLLVALAEQVSRNPLASSPLACPQVVSSMAQRPLVARIRRILKKEEQSMQVSRKTVALLFAAFIAVAVVIGGYCSSSNTFGRDKPATTSDPPGKTSAAAHAVAAPPMIAAAGSPKTAEKPPAKKDNVTPQSEQVVGTKTRPKGNCSLSGVVLDADTGKPVAGARLKLLSLPNFASTAVNAATDGTFTIKDIPEGWSKLQMSDTPGYQDAVYSYFPTGGMIPRSSELLLKGGEHRTGIVFEVKPACIVTGRIRDENGNVPDDIATLSVLAWFEGENRYWPVGVKRVGDDGAQYECMEATVDRRDGSYKIDRLRGKPVYAMAIDLYAAKEGNARPPIYYPGVFSRGEAKLITFDRQKRVDNIDIALRKNGGIVLRGTVRDKAGKPVPEAFVVAHHRDMIFRFGDFNTAYTDEQGRYEIRGLGDGALLVQADAAHRGFVRTCNAIKVAKTSKEPQLDFVLSRGATISGKLVDERGRQWQNDRSDGYANLRDRPMTFRYSRNFRNKHAPKDANSESGGMFALQEGNYDAERMIFPTKCTFLIQGMAPGHIWINFSNWAEGPDVLKIVHNGRDIKESGLDVKEGEEIKGIEIVIGSEAGKPPAANPDGAPKAKEPSAKAAAQSLETSAARPANKASPDNYKLSDEWTTAEQRFPPGFLPLPAYSKLMRLDVRQHYGINAAQEKKLREISATFAAASRKASEARKETQKLPPQERKKKAIEFSEQFHQRVNAVRKQVEDTLTAEQRADYRRDYRCDLAISLCGDPQQTSKALGLTLSKQQEQQLTPLMEEFWENNRKKRVTASEQLLAIFTPQQREKLMARLTDAQVAAPAVDIPAAEGGRVTYTLSVGGKCETPAFVFAFVSDYGASVNVYPQLMFPAVRKELALTAEQEEKLQAVLVKSRGGAQRIFDQFQPKAGAAKPSPEAQTSRRAEFQRALDQFGKDVLAQIEAALQPQQVAALKSIARKDKVFDLLTRQDRAVLDDLHATAEQQGKLRRINEEFVSPDTTSFRAIGEKALGILTPEQRKKLEERLDRNGW